MAKNSKEKSRYLSKKIRDRNIAPRVCVRAVKEIKNIISRIVKFASASGPWRRDERHRGVVPMCVKWFCGARHDVTIPSATLMVAEQTFITDPPSTG